LLVASRVWRAWICGDVEARFREFLDAGLVDTMHVAVAPVELGSGARLWNSPDELLDRFHLEIVPSPSGVTHHLFWRK
jgi:dihydrofolate reductase